MGAELRFLVTRELGRLAKWLRILGFDTKYTAASLKSQIIIESLQENRIILSKNKTFGLRRGIKVVTIKSNFFKQQLAQVISALSIELAPEKFFQRCVICNQVLESVPKGWVVNKVPEYTYNTEDEFVRCPACQRIYWQGSHWGNVEEILKKIKSGAVE